MPGVVLKKEKAIESHLHEASRATFHPTVYYPCIRLVVKRVRNEIG
jgi:hypothetical protein